MQLFQRSFSPRPAIGVIFSLCFSLKILGAGFTDLVQALTCKHLALTRVFAIDPCVLHPQTVCAEEVRCASLL